MMKPNPGKRPRDAIAKRVLVRLVNGMEFEAPAEGKFGVNWSKDLGEHSIASYRVL